MAELTAAGDTQIKLPSDTSNCLDVFITYFIQEVIQSIWEQSMGTRHWGLYARTPAPEGSGAQRFCHPVPEGILSLPFNGKA